MAFRGKAVLTKKTAAAKEAFFVEQECELAKYHAPEPVMVEFHHTKPVFLQNKLYGGIRYGPDLWVCSNCHDSIHAWLYWLLGMRRMPQNVGRLARAEAEKEFQWYVDELDRLNLPLRTHP